MKDMICVTDVRIARVPGYYCEFYHPERMFPVFSAFDPDTPIEHKTIKELVEGTQFVNGRGEQVILGWSKNVHEALGLPFALFEKANTNAEEWRDSFYAMQLKYVQLRADLRAMSLRQRLSFALNGFENSSMYAGLKEAVHALSVVAARRIRYELLDAFPFMA